MAKNKSGAGYQRGQAGGAKGSDTLLSAAAGGSLTNVSTSQLERAVSAQPTLYEMGNRFVGSRQVASGRQRIQNELVDRYLALPAPRSSPSTVTPALRGGGGTPVASSRVGSAHVVRQGRRYEVWTGTGATSGFSFRSQDDATRFAAAVDRHLNSDMGVFGQSVLRNTAQRLGGKLG